MSAQISWYIWILYIHLIVFKIICRTMILIVKCVRKIPES